MSQAWLWRQDQANSSVGPLDLLLQSLPALTLTLRAIISPATLQAQTNLLSTASGRVLVCGSSIFFKE